MADTVLNNNAFGSGSLGNSSNNNLRPTKPFGLNVRVPERTIQQVTETVKSVVVPKDGGLFGYFAKNEDVFNGNVAKETEKLFVQGFNTTQIIKGASLEPVSKFEMHM